MTLSLYSTLSRSQVEDIHRSALKVLADVGVRVESRDLLSLLADHGAEIDLEEERARFAPAWVEQFIADSDKYDWSQHRPSFDCFAGIYQGMYLNPESDRLQLFTETALRDYIRLGNALVGVGAVSLLGLPFAPDSIPAPYGPLAEKLYAWKYGASAAGTVQFTGLCPYLEELYAARAEETGQTLEQVFGAVGYLVSPLRLPRGECEQMLYFKQRGLHMGIGHMLSLGASTPVTVAGAAVVKLAESLFLNILRRALWGGRSLGVGGFGVVMDMQSAHSMGGRPELGAVKAVVGQVARFYGVRSSGGGALTDAKEPSVQAGAQKAMLAMAGIYSCGSASMDAGLLSLDEICSPEQMIHDVELAGAIRHLLRPVDVSAEACAFDDIAAAGPGGNFFGSDLTARRFREELWQPRVWDRQSLQDWRSSGGGTERQRAKDIIRDLLTVPPDEPLISDECEHRLRAVIARAVAAGAAR